MHKDKHTTDFINTIKKASKYFDSDYYFEQRPDVYEANMNPFYHYIIAGWIEGVNPSLKFNTRAYIKDHNPNKCPLIHFIENGEKNKDIYRLDGTSKQDLKSYFKYKKSRVADTVCYTYVSGDYDNLVSHKYVCKDWDYVCFTNNKKLIKKKYVGVWKVVPSQFEELDSKRNSGWHKTHPEMLFKDYKYSVWVDANTNILTDYVINEIKSRKSDLLVPIHEQRDCIYDECDANIELKRDSVESVEKARMFLLKNKMPKHYGLNGTNIVFRNHKKQIIQNIDKMWWDCIEHYSKRDQLSFSYVLYKNGIFPQDISINNTIKDFVNFHLVYHIQNRIKHSNK